MAKSRRRRNTATAPHPRATKRKGGEKRRKTEIAALSAMERPKTHRLVLTFISGRGKKQRVVHYNALKSELSSGLAAKLPPTIDKIIITRQCVGDDDRAYDNGAVQLGSFRRVNDALVFIYDQWSVAREENDGVLSLQVRRIMDVLYHIKDNHICDVTNRSTRLLSPSLLERWG